MATADVSSLYTIIRHQACEAVKWTLRNFTSLLCTYRKYIIKCIDICLNNNFFWYQQTFFQQKMGVAMGAKFAPSVANLFMAQWEEKSVYKHTPSELLLYKRYIDDIIIIWKASKKKLVIFLDGRSQNDRNIQLTWDISKTNISYLDFKIIHVDNNLTTKTHFKIVDRNGFIPMESCHHKNWLYNIPKGRMLRLR